MNDQKSTNDVRMIAQDVARQQTEVCEARRDNLADKLSALASTVSANATAISALTANVAAMLATMSRVDKNEQDIEHLQESVTQLKGRPAVWAAIGAAVPVLLGVLLWWWSNR